LYECDWLIVLYECYKKSKNKQKRVAYCHQTFKKKRCCPNFPLAPLKSLETTGKPLGEQPERSAKTSEMTPTEFRRA
jgi:hypothetical protein